MRKIFLIETVKIETGGLYLLDAPGGVGKTFLISLILTKIIIWDSYNIVRRRTNITLYLETATEHVNQRITSLRHRQKQGNRENSTRRYPLRKVLL